MYRARAFSKIIKAFDASGPSYNLNKPCFAASFSSSSSAHPINEVTIIGAGLMGSGIAQTAAQFGFKVNLIDSSNDALARSRKNIESNLVRESKKQHGSAVASAQIFVNNTMELLTHSTDLTAAAKSSDLLIEAIVENMDAKRKLFTQLDLIAPKHAIFASNTSSLPIAEIAKATSRPGQFAGLHFFNPVPVMKLVEIVRTKDTTEETCKSLALFTDQLLKKAVMCKDTPGFIVNRLLVPYLLEATRIVERGEASKEDVDLAMKLGAGYPMGPFELMDYVGLDTIKFISDGWYSDSDVLKGNSHVAPSQLINGLVAQQKFGKKSGSGFYNYPAKK
ncbi:hypothetical protein BATDEDRAFT_19329 [Batrachochytrium dendrobatidis JAM81]|uniref:3-hydroxyacyl-CoA dehydrogenase n=2 Tax=Batrachochytrium dendrobatidis TaxID=109871 RepID=F4P0M5_BATDJ|nr:uncharacterized protein BATDEDRAFT_19329 [Batrachochytrium dendrobatidis JAM81]EGF81306.1 hypothetical protein BATDEDRAFT_19329 [Batrachochytrium dendrobatidis JAM81]KAJ8329660.1 hypothetical protein O5D80_002225 [Batrachochytrium dendrobatidis]KAK5669557.1 hypothetical protein QVD99_003947 [Batrachochytrium dendrobatidis]OAJ38076.1 hypothetical protein BDEG_22044 [Batrachochytrium dendrobatidis JEL423]|eukprot:XP_006677816.1 hypothetical protein BATDEDRAFT_19329 [Batrachochytrium dendrobatidis JAM81]